MPSTKVIRPKPAEKTKPVKAVTGAGRDPKLPAVRKSRASSCARGPQRDRCEGATATCTTGPGGQASKPSCERRRARSASAAPRPAWPGTNPDLRGATGSVRHPAGKSQEPAPGPGPGPGQRHHRCLGAETKSANQSHRAFTVIPPNPKKRREMQRKAEAELAALEELRLSRAMAYVSINPSSVGGCMSLEEVRMKQQQEMMEAKRKMKPVKTQVMEKTPVLMS